MIGLLMEGAVRALLVAGVVGAGLRLLRVRNVPAEKAAWGLVLAAAVAMPLLTAAGARWQLLPAGATVRIPVELVNMLPWRAENPEPMMRVENEAAAAAKPRRGVDISASDRRVFLNDLRQRRLKPCVARPDPLRLPEPELKLHRLAAEGCVNVDSG